MKSPREIIGNLLQGIEENNIDWDVKVSNNVVRATYECPLTKQRTLSYKIFYDHEKPESSRLTISIVTSTDTLVKTTSVLSIDKQKDGLSIVKEVNYLLDKIINYHSEYRKTQNTEMKVGDRVIVIKKQNFGGEEVGKKGTIIDEVNIGKNKMKYYTICFDIKFSKNLTYSEKAKKDSCWIFCSDHLQKIKMNSTWGL